MLLPAVAGMMEQGDVGFATLAVDMGITIGKVIAFIAIMMLVGRRLVPWIMARSAATGSRELFTLSVLALALGIAFGAVELFDVSFALGAFFAGMVLNESELSHRAAHIALFHHSCHCGQQHQRQDHSLRALLPIPSLRRNWLNWASFC